MSKILISVLLVVVCSSILAKEHWQCDSLGKYTCSKDQTCCRNRISTTGWACFPSAQAVCCSDGLSVCPYNSLCNLKEKKCDPKPKQSNFLEYLTEPDEDDPWVGENDEMLIMLNELVNLSPADAIAFALGFNDGLTFFANISSKSQCDLKDQELFNEVVSIYEILKNISIKDIAKIIPRILLKAQAIYDRIAKLSTGCKVFAADIKTVIDSLRNHIKASGYWTRLALHTISNIGTLSSKVKNAINKFGSNAYKDSGFAIGDLVKFGLFWDFKQ
jgi:hypothetical protein